MSNRTPIIPMYSQLRGKCSCVTANNYISLDSMHYTMKIIMVGKTKSPTLLCSMGSGRVDIITNV